MDHFDPALISVIMPCHNAAFIEDAINSVLKQSYPRVGPWTARNRALAHASGNFIALLDADDVWHPDALTRMHAALENELAEAAWCGWQAIGVAATDPDPKLPPAIKADDAAAYSFEHGAWRMAHGRSMVC